MKQLFPLAALLLLSSCYSEYKTTGATASTYRVHDVAIHQELSATSIFPIIPKHAYAELWLNNQGKSTVQLSGVSLTLKDSPSGKVQQVVDSAAVVELLAGGQHVFHYSFLRQSFLFFPRRATLSMTAYVRDGDKVDTIRQSVRYKRSMYVNLGGD